MLVIETVQCYSFHLEIFMSFQSLTFSEKFAGLVIYDNYNYDSKRKEMYRKGHK